MEPSSPHRNPRVPSPEAPPLGLDRLPLEIQEKIISLLPVRDAVRTSALSRAWRRRWESTPDLRFIWSSGTTPPPAICAVLARYACPVSEFSHGWAVANEGGHTDAWLRLLAGKRVRSLALDFAEPDPTEPFEYYTIHDAVFSCRELTHLDLARCLLGPAPSFFAGFPNLTTLKLALVGLSEHGGKVLETICASPLLELLDLYCVSIKSLHFDKWVIKAPNLRSFTIAADHDYGLQIEELPSLALQTASINIFEYSDDPDPDFVKLFTCFAQTTHLEFLMPPTEDNILEGLSCLLWKLKNLTLHMDFCNIASILGLFSLLRSAPNLKELVIKITYHFNQNEVGIEFYNTLWSNDLFAALDVITMEDARCCSNEMHFIEFVLSKARLLSAIYIYRNDDSDDDDDPNSKPREEAVIKLTKYRRVSPKAKIFFRSMDIY